LSFGGRFTALLVRTHEIDYPSGPPGFVGPRLAGPLLIQIRKGDLSHLFRPSERPFPRGVSKVPRLQGAPRSFPDSF